MQFILPVLAFISAVTALPNGAPVCNIGAANVQNQHLTKSRNPETGPNEKEGYQSILANSLLIVQPLDPTFANLFQFGVNNTLVIQSPVGKYLKGVLVIPSAGNTEEVDLLDTRTPGALYITDTINTKESIGCENFALSSIVHTAPNEKANIAMGFKWPTNGQKLFLDVNIVKNNNATVGSQYYFTQYPMRAGTTAVDTGKCGLLNLSIFCPLTLCGLFGRLLGLCNN